MTRDGRRDDVEDAGGRHAADGGDGDGGGAGRGDGGVPQVAAGHGAAYPGLALPAASQRGQQPGGCPALPAYSHYIAT